VAAWNDGDDSRIAPGKRLREDRAEGPRKGGIVAGSWFIALRQSSQWQRRQQGLNDDGGTAFATAAALLRARWGKWAGRVQMRSEGCWGHNFDAQARRMDGGYSRGTRDVATATAERKVEGRRTGLTSWSR
jgi:hypothetical protein